MDPGPEHAFLLIEVADSSLEHDQRDKVPRDAAAGIAEAWLVNLPGDVIELYREPRGSGYAAVRTARRGETVFCDGLRAFGYAVAERTLHVATPPESGVQHA